MLVTAAIALTALAACQPERHDEKELPKVIAETVTPVEFSPTVELTGVIAPRVESNLSFRVGGQVAERLVDVGDHVEQGQLLARIETDEPQATLEAAEAAQRANEATLKQSQANFERQRTLFKGGYTTQSAFDAAQEQLRSAQNSLEASRSDVATAREQLTYTDLKSPAAGVITERSVEQGQVVAAAQTVFSLALDGARDAVFDIDERAMTEEPVGRRVAVRLVSDPSVTATAVIREISPVFDKTSGTLRVKLGLIDAPSQIGLGAAVVGTATFPARKVVRLPATALYSTKAEPSVWVVDPKTNTVSQRVIEIDRYLTGAILVADGLQPGDVVVTKGTQLLLPGQAVSVVEAGKAAGDQEPANPGDGGRPDGAAGITAERQTNGGEPAVSPQMPDGEGSAR
ncbi:efflux RND transporter periplasmic adaptor subunit [Mangrovicella endophytica]|uniref:efflux RND transporter periplasmic adaptor subunit n=1 Tax=Mangrovicella endophytica TaxID=2066697 RepID=UPI000C9E3D5A|nr:efflux RND transporter periplasmic adaptor subunit [Mangrovicella endophytica]